MRHIDGQVHANRVLYKVSPVPGHTYRQIVVIEWDHFQVHILEGDVIQPDPQFKADSQDAEAYFPSSLKDALDDTDAEFKASQASGWLPY